MPKPVSQAWPVAESTRMLPGLTFLWLMPRACGFRELRQCQWRYEGIATTPLAGRGAVPGARRQDPPSEARVAPRDAPVPAVELPRRDPVSRRTNRRAEVVQ